jgi:nitrous oxidase accessory protein NosD
MLKMKYSLLLVAVLFSQTVYTTLFAQCNNVTLSAVSTPATCFSNGTITVTVGGADAVNLRMSDAQFRLLKNSDVYTNWTTWSESADSLTKTFNTAASGDYRIEMRAFCQNLQEWTKHTIATQVTVQGNYTPLESSVVTPRKSMNCRNTGKVEVKFTGGTPPYAVAVTAQGNDAGGTSYTTSNPGITIDDLAPGDYRVSVSDGCRSTSAKTFTVGTIAADVPASLHADMSRSGTDCRSVMPSSYSSFADPDLKYYWDNAASYYEYGYLLNDAGTPTWKPLSTKRPIYELPDNYRDFCDSGDSLISYIRPKGCESVIKRIKHTFSSVCNPTVFTVRTLTGATNTTAKLNCYISPACEVVYPATWEITTTPGLIIDSGRLAGNETVISEASTSKEYTRGTSYTITLTDAANNAFTVNWTPQVIPEQTQTLRGTVSNNNGYSCMDNPDNPIGSSYIYLYTSSGNIQPGTTIEYVSGPQPLGMGEAGTVYTIPANYNATQFYPTSVFPYKTATTPVSILTPGSYLFKVTHPGGTPYNIRINKSNNYHVEEIAYTTTLTCNGLQVIPTGGLQLVNASGQATNIDAYFRIVSGPAGTYYSTNAVEQGEELLLQSSGTYRIEMLVSPNSSCAIAATDIVYEGLSIDLEHSSYYHCEGESAGFIRLKALNGVEPYTYTVTNAPGSAEIEPQTNQTGVFPEIGVAGETYLLSVQDACGNSSMVSVTMLDLANANIAYTLQDGVFCEGTNIQISCLALGEAAYQWTGPNGFESIEQKPNNMEARYPGSTGAYSVTVTPENCALPITNTLEIEVLPAPALEVEAAEISLCVGSDFHNVVALAGITVDSDCELIWYNNRGSIINPPTAHSTMVVGTTKYYVSRACKNDECKTARTLIQVTVLPKEECCPMGEPSAHFEEKTSTFCSTPVSSALYLEATATQATLTARAGSGVAAGSLSHSSVTESGTVITYTPAAEDAGKTITITAVTDIPEGCLSAPATATWEIIVPRAFTQSDPSSQVIAFNTAHTFLLNAARGGLGEITYLWEQSYDNQEWTTAPGNNNEVTYTTPQLTENIYYRRKAIAETCGGTITSSAALLMMLDDLTGVYEYYVKEESTGTGDGSSWENAISNEHFARILPFVPDGVTFHIAAGTYYPMYEQHGAFSQSIINRTFAINSSVTLIGGYPADAQTGDASEPEKYKTLFDGKIEEGTVNNLFDADLSSLKLSLKGLYLENTTSNAIEYASTSSELYLDNVSVSNSGGYAVYAQNTLVLEVENAAFYKNNGVINTNNSVGKTILNNVRMEENSGNLLVECRSESIEITQVVATNNDAQLLRAYGEKLTITKSDFENNRCSNNHLIACYSSDSVIIRESTIRNNRSSAGSGGVYCSNSEANVKIERTVFDGNQSSGNQSNRNATHLYALTRTVSIDNCIFKNGKSEEFQHDALFVNCSENSEITHSTFENNSAEGILYLNAKGNLLNNTFTGNKAGNIISFYSRKINATHNTVVGNECTYAFYYASGRDDMFTGNIVLGNSGESFDACLYGHCPKSTYNLFSADELPYGWKEDESDIIVEAAQKADYLKILDGEYNEATALFTPHLKDNGGFTPTIALTGTELPDGKTINSVPLDISGVLTDQRGKERNNPACIGAYEYADTIPEPQPANCPADPFLPAATDTLCFKFPASESGNYVFYQDAEGTTPVLPSAPVTSIEGVGTVCISGNNVSATYVADSAYYTVWMVDGLTPGTPIDIAGNKSMLKWGWQDPSATRTNFTVSGTANVRIESADIMVYSYWGNQCGDITPHIYTSDGTLLYTGTTQRVCTENTTSYDKVSLDFGYTLPAGDYYITCTVTNRTDPANFCLGLYEQTATTTGTVNGETVITNIGSSNGRYFFTDIAFSLSSGSLSATALTTACPLPCTMPAAPAATSLTLCAGEPAPDITQSLSYDTTHTLIWYADTTQAALAEVPVISTVNNGSEPIVTTYYVSQSNAPCESYKASVTITVNPKPHIAPLDTVCNKDSLFIATLLSADITGIWSSNRPAVASIDSLGHGTVFPDRSGEVSITFTNTFGCSDTTTVNITAECGIVPVPRTDECPENKHKLRPEATDNICFEFKVIPPQPNATYTIYDAASGGSIIADSLTVETSASKLICVSGDKIQTVTPQNDTVYYSVWVDENKVTTLPEVNDTTITVTTTTQEGLLSSTGIKTGWFDRSCTRLNLTTTENAVTLTTADIILGNYAAGNTITATIQPTVFRSNGTVLCTPEATQVSYSENPAIRSVSLGDCLLPADGSYYIQYTVTNINNTGWYNDQVAFSNAPTTVTGTAGLTGISNSNCNGSGVLFNNLQYSIIKTDKDTVITHRPGETIYEPAGKRVKLTSSCGLSCLEEIRFDLEHTQPTLCLGDTASIRLTAGQPVDMSEFTAQWTFPNNNLEIQPSGTAETILLKALPGAVEAPVAVALTDFCGGTVTLYDTLLIYGKEATFEGLDDNTLYCKGSAPVKLTPLNPGGMFEGEGITGDEFDPQAVTSGSSTITYTITDNGCVETEQKTIRVPQAEPLVAAFGSEDVSCTQTSDGFIVAEVQGGKAPYTYLWSSITAQWTQEHHATGVDTLSALPAGEYRCLVTDANGCTVQSDNITITQLNLIELSLKEIFYDERQRCYGVDNSRVYVNLNPYSAFTDVQVTVTSETYEKTILCQAGEEKANFDGLAPGIYRIFTRYTMERCPSALDTTIEIKRMTQELSIDNDVEIKHQTCLSDPNGSITFTAKGVVAGQTATAVMASDNTIYTLFPIKLEEENATYRISGLKSGTYTLRIENVCGHTAEKTVEITSIEPYRLELDEALSDTFIECPYEFGEIVFTYSGGNYPVAPIRLEYDSSRTVTVVDRIEQRVTYQEEIVKDTVYVNDSLGFPVRDEEGNLLTEEIERTVYKPVIVYDTLRKEVTERVPVVMESTQAEKSDNRFTFSSLQPREYFVIYESAEPGCSDSTGLTVSITASHPVSVQTEVLPVSCLGYSDGIISIYPHRAGDPEYYLVREGKDPESFTYYTAEKTNDTTYIRSEENHPLHNLIGFKNDSENKKLEKYNPQTDTWEIIRPEEASRRDEFGNFFYADGDTVKVPVWSNRHTTDFWEGSSGNMLKAGVMTIAGLSEGRYRYTVVDTQYGCIYTDTVSVTFPNSALHIDNVVFDATAAYCDPEKRQVEVHVSGGWGEYVYSFKDINIEYPEKEGSLWDGFLGGEIKKYDKNQKTGYLKSRILAPGVYELYVTDEKGCMIKHDEQLNVTTKITLSDNPPYQLQCPNDSSVEVTIQASGGASSDYIYKKFERQCEKIGIFTDDCQEVIVPTDPNSNTFRLSAGTHGLFAYETTGEQCGGYIEVEVKNNYNEEFLFFKKAFHHLLCHEDMSGAAEVRVSGATSPYSFYHSVEGSSSLQSVELTPCKDALSDYYRIEDLTAGKHKLKVEDQNGCSKELEFELTQPEPLALTTKGSPICAGAQTPIKGNVFAESVTGGATPYTYYVSNDNLDIGDVAAEHFVGNKFFDVEATPGQQFHYYVKDANGCIVHEPVQLEDGEVSVDKLDFLASTWRYDSDALLLVDLSEPPADSIVYSFGEDDDKIVVQDKRLYTYAVAGSDSLMSLAGKDMKSVPDSFFTKNFTQIIPDSVASKYTFILLQDSALMQMKNNEAMKNQLLWYKHKVVMTYYKMGCAFTIERDSFMIANSDSLIYGVGNFNQKDILNLELSPNPLDKENNLKITITFGNKVDYTIYLYNTIGQPISPSPLQGKAEEISDSMQREYIVQRSQFTNDVTAVVVLVTTSRDAASKVLLLK